MLDWICEAAAETTNSHHNPVQTKSIILDCVKQWRKSVTDYRGTEVHQAQTTNISHHMLNRLRISWYLTKDVL